MTKQLSPLEELKFIRQFEINEDHRTLNDHIICRSSLDNIETALKDSEWYKNEMIKFEKAFTEENEEKLKLQKVLEIIKEKGLNVDYFQRVCDEEYEESIFCIEKLLTQEQFDLLKEELK